MPLIDGCAPAGLFGLSVLRARAALGPVAKALPALLRGHGVSLLAIGFAPALVARKTLFLARWSLA